MRRSRLVLLPAVPLVAAAALTAATAPDAGAATGTACTGWTVSTVASGLGSLENFLPDGAGGFYLSATDKKAVEHLTATGTVSSVVAGVDTPGGLVRAGSTLYFLTGDSTINALFNTAGTLAKVDLTTGATSTIAKVVAPNGLLRLPDGGLIATTESILGTTGITRIDPVTGAAQKKWSPLAHSDGVGISPDGSTVYTDDTYTDDTYTGDVDAIPVATPATVRRVGSIGSVLDGADDLITDHSGVLYVAANLAGLVDRFDPATGATCAIASGLTNPSSVRIARGTHGEALFVSGWDGTLKELDPPAGVTVTP